MLLALISIPVLSCVVVFPDLLPKPLWGLREGFLATASDGGIRLDGSLSRR